MKSLLFSFWIVCLFSGMNPVAGQTDIKGIRFGSKGDPLNGLTIAWNSTGTNDSIAWGYTPDLENGESAGLQSTSISGTRFEYTFPVVTAGSTIHYALYDSKDNLWSEEMTFKTASDASDDQFSFTVIGDSRSNPDEWQIISQAIPDSDFTLFMGDIVNSGSSSSDWEKWFEYGKEFISREPIYHTIGNHDTDNSPRGYDNYLGLFNMPGNELYYSFTYGNAVFICLNSLEAVNASQYSWLLQTLETNKNQTWKVVFFHKPFYTSPTHTGEMNSYFHTLWKAFDDYGVDILLNGHTHNYQRTKPINRKISRISSVETYGCGDGQGRCQIVVGNAGAPLSPAASSSLWWLDNSVSKRHFCNIEIDGDVLTFKAMDANNVVFDEFILDKSSSDITFRVDLNEVTDLYNGGAVWLDFSTPDSSYEMTDTDGDSIYTVTVPAAAGTDLKYYFSYQTGADPDTDFDEESVPAECSDAEGHRLLKVSICNLTLPAVLYGSCDEVSDGESTISIPVTMSSDDAEEGSINGAMALESSDLELGEFDTWSQNGIEQGLQTIGIRFNDIAIPSSATILSASIQFASDNTGDTLVQLTIFGEDVGNAVTFDNTAYNITTRTKTAERAVWDVPPWPDKGDAGPDQQTVDLANIVQAIVNREDWASGNSIAFIMEHSGPSIGRTSSSNGREAETSDGTAVPVLTVTFLEGGGVGVNSVQAEFTSNIYPNPTTGILFIYYPSADDFSCEIFSINGKLVLSKHNIKGSTTKVDMSGLRSGIYIVDIRSGERSEKHKIILR